MAERKNLGHLPDILAAKRALPVGLLSNPYSGGNRKGLASVRAVLSTYPQVFHREAHQPIDVASALNDFARMEVNLVIINGGDGTIQAVLTTLYREKIFENLPILAVLKAGTSSMIAGDVGLKGPQTQALRKLLAWVHDRAAEARVSQRQILRVQVAFDKEPIYGMFFGTAGIYQGVQFCNNRLNRRGFRGKWAPGLTIAMFLLAVAFRRGNYVVPVPISVSLDQNPPDRQHWFLMMISTLERLFFGMRPYWGIEAGPLRYTAVHAKPLYLLRALPALMGGRKSRYGTRKNGYFSHNVQQVQLNLNSGFTLDGELFEARAQSGPVVVQNGGPARFVRL